MIAENSEIDFDDENKSYVAFNEVVADERHQGVRSSWFRKVYNVLLSLIDFDSTLDCAIFHLNCAIFH